MKYMRRNASNKHVKVKSMVMKHTAESIRVVEYQQEREILYDNLFTSRTFKYKIRPIVGEYQHRRAMECRGHHLYSCRTSPSPRGQTELICVVPCHVNFHNSLPHQLLIPRADTQSDEYQNLSTFRQQLVQFKGTTNRGGGHQQRKHIAPTVSTSERKRSTLHSL